MEPLGVNPPQHILAPFLLYSRSGMEQKNMLHLGSFPAKQRPLNITSCFYM
jgi:hypothetical protein